MRKGFSSDGILDGLHSLAGAVWLRTADPKDGARTNFRRARPKSEGSRWGVDGLAVSKTNSFAMKTALGS